MKHLIVAAFTAFLSLFQSHATTYTKMVDRVSSSIVRITVATDEGDHTCSGEVIGVNRVLTAGHCFGALVQADGIQAKVLKVDKWADLMVLSVLTSKPAITFRDSDVVRFEDLTAIGYAFGWTKLSIVRVQAYLLNIDPFDNNNEAAPGLIVQGAYISGMSGGPVVDADGRMVGIVQQANQGVGYGVGTQLMKAFLLGVE